MRHSLAHLAALLGFWTFTAGAGAVADEACFDKARTQAELTECAARDLKQADDELNRLYKEIEARLKGDDGTRKLLVDAQRKWVAFRDAECTLRTSRSAGGSINAMNVNSCAAELTQGRVKALKSYLDCGRQTGEQDAADCAVPAGK